MVLSCSVLGLLGCLFLFCILLGERSIPKRSIVPAAHRLVRVDARLKFSFKFSYVPSLLCSPPPLLSSIIMISLTVDCIIVCWTLKRICHEIFAAVPIISMLTAALLRFYASTLPVYSKLSDRLVHAGVCQLALLQSHNLALAGA